MSKFQFVPRLPTKEAWESKAFKTDYWGEQDFLSALISKDSSDNMKGYIYFREGIVSEYKDGTEGHTYDTRKWWELGYTCCANRCCFSPPNTKLMEWKEEDGREALSAIMKEHETVVAANHAKHLANPRPMPKFKRTALPIKREWQEFKRIKGPGGFIEQYGLIKDKGTIRTIFLLNHGNFYIVG